MNRLKNSKKLLSMVLAMAIMLSTMFVMPTVSAAVDAYEEIQAISYDRSLSKSDPVKDLNPYNGRVGNMYPEAYLAFPGIDFGDTFPIRVDATTGVSAGLATELRFILDNPENEPFAVVPITPFSFSEPYTDTTEITAKIKGIHTVYVKTNKGTLDFLSFQFYTVDPNQQTYTPYDKESIYSDLKGKDARNVDMLYQLGMISGTGDLFNMDMPATRGDVAKAAYGMLVDVEAETKAEEEAIANGEVIPAIETPFDDVKSTSEYAKAAAYLSQNGIMNGVSRSEFDPLGFASKIDAATVMLRILGYEEIAERQGGYPGGYAQVLSKLNLLSGDNTTDTLLTRRGLVNLIHNTLKAECLNVDGLTGDNVTYAEYKRILEIKRNLHYGEGQVDATKHTVLGKPGSNLSANEVSINGVTYSVGSTKAEGLLGFETNFYYEEIDGVRTIRAIVPDNNCEMIEIVSSKDTILGMSNNEISYIPEGETKDEEVELDKNARVIYNGVASEKNFINSIASKSNFTGKIRVINNNGGSQVITIDEYEDYIVDSIASDKTQITCDGGKKVLDWSDDDCVIIEDKYGIEVKIKKIPLDSVITVYESKNTSGTKLIRIYVDESEVIGKVNKIENGRVFIDDVKHAASNLMDKKPQLGQEGIFRLNIYGDIVEAKALDPSDWSIGLFMAYDEDDGLDNAHKIKIMTLDAKPIVYDLADKIIADGVLVRDKDKMISGIDGFDGFKNIVSEKAIRYRLNGDNKLAAVDTAETVAGGPNDVLVRSYDGYDKNVKFAYYSNVKMLNENDGVANVARAKFYVANNAKIFTFNGDANIDRENNCIAGNFTTIINSNAIKLSGVDFYSTTGEKYYIDLVVWKDAISDSEATLSPKLVVYKDEIKSINEDGQPTRVIEGWSGGATVKYTLDKSKHTDSTTIGFLDYVKPGDVMEIKAYPDGTIFSATPILFADGEANREGYANAVTVHKGTTTTGATIGSKQRYGRVIDRENQFAVLQVGGTTQNPDVDLIQLENISICKVSKSGTRTIIEDIKPENIQIGDVMYVYLSSYVPDAYIIYDTGITFPFELPAEE